MKPILLIPRERQRHSPIDHSHAPRPSRRRRLGLYREAAHLEAERRQLVEVGELFHVAVADLAAGLVAFPDDAGVAGFEEALVGEGERRVPAQAVDAGDAHAHNREA
jgi:hypothetical protein